MIHNLMLISQTPLLETTAIPYTGITYHNKYLYAVNGNNYIIVQDIDLNFITTIPTQNSYHSICFDNIDECFWVIGKNSTVYKLNPITFYEIDSIYIKGIKKASISFDNNCNNLIFTTHENILHCTKAGIILTTYQANSREINSACCSANGCLVKVSYYIGCDVSLFSILHDNYARDNINCLPQDCIAHSLVSIGEQSGFDLYLFVLTTKLSKYSNIIKYLWCQI